MTDLTTLADKDLDLAIGAAFLDGDTARLKALEAEHDRRRREEARQRLAEAERIRRAEAETKNTAEALLDKLTRVLSDCEQQHRDDLAALDVAPHDQTIDAIECAYMSGRRLYTRAHGLYEATGDRRFYRPYRTPDELKSRKGAAADAYLISIRGRPIRLDSSEDIAWEEDIKRLRALLPRHHTIANGG